MRNRTSTNLSFVGRFALLFGAMYALSAVLFRGVVSLLPDDAGVAVRFFEPYSLSLGPVLGAFVIGAVIAAVLLPFSREIVQRNKGGLILFAALWGVVLLGSLEPKPGSIEGMLYTVTSAWEHLLVVSFGAVQYAVFVWLLLRWERSAQGVSAAAPQRTQEPQQSAPQPLAWFEPQCGVKLRSYLGRFTTVHVVVYWVVGGLFYQISGYEEALATMEIFTLWRELQNLTMPVVILLGQIVRGAFIALLLAPLYHVHIQHRYGWLQLFGLLFGLKVFAAIFTVPTSTPELRQMLADLQFGVPEIVVQTAVFALVFFAVEKRAWRMRLAE